MSRRHSPWPAPGLRCPRIAEPILYRAKYARLCGLSWPAVSASLVASLSVYHDPQHLRTKFSARWPELRDVTVVHRVSRVSSDENPTAKGLT